MGLIHRSEDVDVIHGAAYRALEMSNVPEYTQYPTHLTQEPVDLVSYPRTQRLGRPRRRGRGGRNVQEAGTSNWATNFETGGDQDPVLTKMKIMLETLVWHKTFAVCLPALI